MVTELMSYGEWLSDADLPMVRKERVRRFALAFPELANENLLSAVPRRGRRGGLYNRALRAAVVLARDMAITSGGVLTTTALTKETGDRLIDLGLGWEKASNASRERTSRVELRLPAPLDVQLFTFAAPPVKGCRMEVSSGSGGSVERTWTVMSAGILRGRTNKTTVAMESSFPVTYGQRRALVIRMHGHAVYALEGGRPQPVVLEPISRDTTHALRTEELPKSGLPAPGPLLCTFDGGADGRTDSYMYQESVETAVRYGGQVSALEGEVSARLVMERALRLTIRFAPGHAYHLHRTLGGNGITWTVD